MSAADQGGDRLRAVALAAVMLVAAVSMGVAGLGAADGADGLDDAALENLTLDADPADANAASTHTWSFDDAEFDGEVDEITVEYPDGTSLDGLTNDDVTVTLVRQLTGGPDESEISVNSGSYDGTEATFDLSGSFNTDLVGAGSVVVDGIENPDSGEYAPTITLSGDDDELSVTADLVVAGDGDENEGDDGNEDDENDGDGDTDDPAEGTSLTLDPATADATSTHTWSFDDIDFDGEVDEVVATYPDGASFDGLTNDDVTVALTRSGESEPTEISVNADEYDGTEATFDLSGVFNTDIDGATSVTIDGLLNPEAGEYEPTLTFVGEDDAVTAPATMVVEGDDVDTLATTFTDGDGEPIAETDVLLTLDGVEDATADEEVVTVATTDADGGVVVDVPQPGAYELTATAQGVGEATEPVDIDGETTVSLALTAAETGSIDALVTDADGEALPEGSWVQLDSEELDAPRTGQVDADGTVLIEGIEPGEYDLSAETTAAGTTDLVSVQVDPGETTTAEFTYADAPTTADLVGTVTDPDGEPLATETVVIAYDAVGDEGDDGAAVVETDADGGFTVSRIAAGTYEVTATAAGTPPSDPVTVDISAGESAALSLFEPTPEPGTVSGVVTDADGDPLAEGTWVTFSAEADGFGPDKTVQLDANGGFEFGEVAPGSYDIVAETLDRGETDEHKVNVAAGGSTDGVEISYAEDDSPGNGPPSGTPGEGPPGNGNGPPGDSPGNGPPSDSPGNGPPGNGNGPPALAPVL